MLRKISYTSIDSDTFSLNELQIIAEHTGSVLHKGWKPDSYWMSSCEFVEDSIEHMLFLKAIRKANTTISPSAKWIEWEHDDLINAEFVRMVIQEVLEEQVSEERAIYKHGYDLSEMCSFCRSGAKQGGILGIDKKTFSEMQQCIIAEARHWEKIVKEPFKQMITNTKLTGIEFLPTRDSLLRDDQYPPVYQIRVTSMMPPALINDDMAQCPECGRFSSGIQSTRYSRSALDHRQLCDFNLAFEWPMSPISPELMRPSIVVKSNVYKVCHENGIGRDQIVWDVVQIE